MVDVDKVGGRLATRQKLMLNISEGFFVLRLKEKKKRTNFFEVISVVLFEFNMSNLNRKGIVSFEA